MNTLVERNLEPELLADYGCIIGEGPLWHPEEKVVYWIDIRTGRLFRYDPRRHNHELCHTGDEIGGFTLQDDGALLLFQAHGMVSVWRDRRCETVIDEIDDERGTRFNDVIADPVGRVFCGTMPNHERNGRLYRMDLDGSLTIVLEGIGCSNGMGFTLDGRSMYYTDSVAHEIYVFDYEVESGALSNRRLFARTLDEEGVPDGLTVDAQGGIWSARWNGGCLVRYNPDGRLTHRIEFPARKVSSVAFGGPDYRDMYITTAGGDHKETEGSGAGALFRISGANHSFRGVPEFRSRIGRRRGKSDA